MSNTARRAPNHLPAVRECQSAQGQSGVAHRPLVVLRGAVAPAQRHKRFDPPTCHNSGPVALLDGHLGQGRGCIRSQRHTTAATARRGALAEQVDERADCTALDEPRAEALLEGKIEQDFLCVALHTVLRVGGRRRC